MTHPLLIYRTSYTCLCLRHRGLMFCIISVSAKPMFLSREDRSSASQSFSLPHIMFHLINVSPKHIFQSGEDRSSALQSFSLPHVMFRLISVSPIHMYSTLLCTPHSAGTPRTVRVESEDSPQTV